jgi:sec-independent protein translocase protein TatB
LPEIARQVGKALNEFKRASNEFKAQIEQEISNLEVENRQTILPPSPTPEGATSRKLYAAPVEAGPADAHPAEALATAVPGTEVPTTETPTTEARTTEARTTEARTTQAAADDEPLFAAAGVGSPESSPAATEAVSSPAIAPSDGVTAPTSQESHV